MTDGEIDGWITESCLVDSSSYVSWRKRLIGSKSNAASISAQACGNVDNENGRRLQMDPKTVERRESKEVRREDEVE